jgi:hypothetical protein
VFILAAALAYHLEHADPGYAEVATVAFTAPRGQAQIFNYAGSLVVVDELAAHSVMSAPSQQQVRNLGGTASYDVALVNLSNEDFPNYSNPYVTVTTTSPDPVAAQDTFTAVMTVLRQDLATMQARQGAKPGSWIQARTISGPSGPVAQTGSRKRSLAGLAVLALIAAYMTAAFLDRRSFRLRDLLRRYTRMRTSGQGWRAVRVRPKAQ